MYAKSMLEYARARATASTWSRHLGFVPVVLAWTVAVLPFTLEWQYARFPASGGNSTPLSQGPSHSQSRAMLENPFHGLVLAAAVTEAKRPVMALDAQQRAVAAHITRKFGVSSEVVQELVRTAFAAGTQFGVDPLLVVAIMAVESSFNPIAESVAGAKGLMQIIPKYHLEKFADFGGEHTIFDPRVNILVGARIVREYLLMASGDLFTALQTYAGALADRDAAYTNRVLNEKDLLDSLTGGNKTERGNRVTLQLNAMKPGTLVVPRIAEPTALPGPVEVTPASPPAVNSPSTAAPSTPPPAVHPSVPMAKAVEEAKLKLPALPAPVQSPAPGASGVALTQNLPESVLRF